MIKTTNLGRLKTTLTSALIIGVVLTGCKSEDNCISCKSEDNCIKGQGARETRTLSIPDFTGVEVFLASKVTINQGAKQEVKVIGHDNIMDKLNVSVENNIWEIRPEGNFCYEHDKKDELSIDITIPDITSINLSGSGEISVKDFTNQKGLLTTTIEGSGDVNLNKFEGITSHEVYIAGSGSFTANEDISVSNLDVTIEGSGKYAGFSIRSDSATVDLSDSGRAELTVSSKLDVYISGSGEVYYRGQPTITRDISGSGELKEVE